MNLIIRFGYCPSSPGPKAKIRNKWYRGDEIKDAIHEWDGNSEIWISYNKQKYRQISFIELCRIYENEFQYTAS